MPKDALHDLELLFRYRHGLVYIETAATRPFSVTMSEKISAMRQWAEGRAVRAK
jgi:hypothetical protein